MTFSTCYCLCDTFMDPRNVCRYVLEEGKMKTLSLYKHGRNGLFPKFWENKWQTVGSIISRDCIAFIFEVQAILCLHCDDEGPIRSLKKWSTSNRMVRHISGQQNPSSLWDIFGQRQAMFQWTNEQWMIRTYRCTLWTARHNTARATECIKCRAGSNCHHCMCSLGLLAPPPPIQSASPPMAAHLQYQTITLIITQFLVTFGNSSFQSTSVPLPNVSFKLCCCRSQPSSASGYSWYQPDRWSLQSRLTLKQLQKVVLFTYVWNNSPPCSYSADPCIRLLSDTTTMRCYFLSAHLSRGPPSRTSARTAE
jgi:hypothetical protein